MVAYQMDALQTKILMNYGIKTQLKDLGIHPKYPFNCLFRLYDAGFFFPDELLQFLCYFFHNYYISIEIHTGFLYNHLENLSQIPYSRNFNKFFSWFATVEEWEQKLREELKGYRARYERLKVSNA